MLELKDVTGGYSRKPVLHDLSFEIGQGELVGLIGLNGAGKSTTIKHIIGLMNAHSGEIRVNGVTFSEDPEIIESHLRIYRKHQFFMKS